MAHYTTGGSNCVDYFRIPLSGGSLHWEELGGVNGDLRCGKGTTWEVSWEVVRLFSLHHFRALECIIFIIASQSLSFSSPGRPPRPYHGHVAGQDSKRRRHPGLGGQALLHCT